MIQKYPIFTGPYDFISINVLKAFLIDLSIKIRIDSRLKEEIN